MARLSFGGCRPEPGGPCPNCGQPVRLVPGLRLIPGGRPEDWIVCSAAPRCFYTRLYKRPKRPARPRRKTAARS